MKIDKAIEKALEAKTNNDNIATYVRRESWKKDNKYADTILSPHGFSKQSLCHLHIVNKNSLRISGSFTPTVEDVLADDWVVYSRVLNDCKQEDSNTTPTSNNENVSKALEQLILAKGYLNELNRSIKAMKLIFEKTYGICFEKFALYPEIICEEEDRINAIFVALASDVDKMVGNCLKKAIKELDTESVDEKTE